MASERRNIVRKFVKSFYGNTPDELDKEINNFIPKVHNVINVSFSVDGTDLSSFYHAMVLYENESRFV